MDKLQAKYEQSLASLAKMYECLPKNKNGDGNRHTRLFARRLEKQDELLVGFVAKRTKNALRKRTKHTRKKLRESVPNMTAVLRKGQRNYANLHAQSNFRELTIELRARRQWHPLWWAR